MAIIYPPPEQDPLRPGEEPAQPIEDSEAAAYVGERPHAPEIKPPTGAERIRYNLYSRETRVGRFLRGLILGLIIFVGLIGIGALAVYVAIATPAEEQLQGMRVQATQTTVDLQRAQQDRDDAVQQRQEADTRAEEAEEQLAQEVTRNQVLRVMNAVLTAQVAVVEEDSAEAGRALTTAENILRQAKPRLDQLDPSYTATFENLFSLARNDLERDLNFAAQDLERIRVELTRLDDALE